MKIKFAFWGTDEFSVNVLEALKTAELLPSLIVTAPDRPAGRGNKMRSPSVKIWAEENGLKVVQPEKLNAEFIAELKNENCDLFALASYGKIIPQAVLDLPAKGTLNVHPSLLPKYRGAPPIESAMLTDDKETGVTIMLMDDKMDHDQSFRRNQFFSVNGRDEKKLKKSWRISEGKCWQTQWLNGCTIRRVFGNRTTKRQPLQKKSPKKTVRLYFQIYHNRKWLAKYS